MLQTLPDTAEVSSGHLHVGGCDAVDLARRFGTPVLLLDRATFEARARAYARAAGAQNVFYAGKAFLCVAICELTASLGLSLDVCTGGELATAIVAGFPPERLLLHGSNKSLDELRAATETGVGRIVVDSSEEIVRLKEVGSSANLLVRVTPGVEAHTHEFVQTGQEDSKFGFSLGGGVALEGLRAALSVDGTRVTGIHAHIGSHIFDLAAFELAIHRIAAFCRQAREELGFEAEEVNLGGGLGIAHTEHERAPEPESSSRLIAAALGREFSAVGLGTPRLALEPGRSIVGPAAVTLYSVGTVKRVPGVRTYVSVDGGMGDNIRPALYGAKYKALLANRMNDRPEMVANVVGKFCESGDFLVKDAALPEDAARGDLLCIPATGAYTYSMASNYNRQPRPAVVMVENGKATEIITRETYEDIFRADRRLDGGPL
jgi:diaminopimelate decarboxylase